MLANTRFRLENERKLTVGYFGGSITDGTGASDSERTSYRAILTRGLREAWPEAAITEINASIGGTGTGYGMYRIERDLLKDKPDLVFVEFAANDWGDSYENVLPRAEVLLRKIRRLLPETETVALFTMYNAIMEDLMNGLEYESRSAIASAAHHYGNPVISPGDALYARILLGGGNFSALIPDGVHPNDTGHRIMGQCVLRNLLRLIKTGEVPGALHTYEMPKPLCQDLPENARMVDVKELTGLLLDGFTLKEENGKSYLEGLSESDSFSFRFRGRGFGFCWKSRQGINGDVLVRIDGAEPVRVESWDHAVRSFARMEKAIVTTALEPGREHTVEVSACGTVQIEALFLC